MVVLTLSKGCNKAPFVVLLKPINAAPFVQEPTAVAFLTCTLVPGPADLTAMLFGQREEER